MFRRRGGKKIAGPQRGAQRASTGRSARLVVFAVTLALAALSGLATNPSPAAAAAGMKVVVVVGPAGSSTAKYIANGKRYAAQARSYGAKVIELYSPNATWSQGQGRGPGRQRPHLPRPWQRVAQPVRSVEQVHQGWARPELLGRPWQQQPEVLRRVLHPDTRINLAPNAVVILNRLCYASGNSEWGAPNPTKTTGQEARRQLRERLPAGQRAGGLRRGDHERLVHPVRPVQDEPVDRVDLHELVELEHPVRLPVPVAA